MFQRAFIEVISPNYLNGQTWAVIELCQMFCSTNCISLVIWLSKQKGGGGGGGGKLYFFPPKFLDPLWLPVWRHIVTSKRLGSLVQISKGYDSYVDERGRGKAKKQANIAICRLFDRMCVSFVVAIICLCKQFWYLCPWLYNFVNLFCWPCCGIAIYFTGPTRSSNLFFFFSKIGKV